MELTPRTSPDPSATRPSHRRKPWVYLVLAAVLGALGVVVYQGLTSASLYFYNADEAVEEQAELGDRRFRMQGLVVDGTVVSTDSGVDFTVTYEGVDVAVRHQGDPPELFQPGIPVVIEGRWDPSGEFFASDTIRVKHSEQYQADNRDRLDDAERQGTTRSTADPRAVNATLGAAGVVLGASASILGAITMAVGLRRKRPRILEAGWSYSLLVLLGAVVAVVAMQRALITRDFSVGFVHDHGSSRTPRLFNVATMWSALEGSILLWAVILAGFTVHVARKFRQRLADPLVGWALLTMFVVCGFFFLLMVGPANPFTTVSVPAGFDGPGPNPLLQEHLLMAFHPPMLYLGYVGFTVPFAFAVAALATGRLGEGWLIETRRATLVAWGFLTAGIVLGAWWSYEVLGWGGYWGWDPVENASLLPWLTGTAYLHSVMVQERRGMLRVWNLSLLCATFSLTILGTFLTRSGVLESVHAFSDGDIGVWLLAFFALIVAVTLGLIGWRGDQLPRPGRIDSPLSREGAFLANNVLFAGFAFVVLLGTVFPLIVEALQDRPLTVGPPYFDRMTTPIGIVLLFLMALAPVLPWRKASTELLSQRLLWPAWAGALTLFAVVAFGARGWAPILAFGLGGFAGGAALRQVVLATRRQGWRGLVGRTNGGMVVHLGVVIVAVAIAASGSYANENEARYEPGQTRVVGGHEITYLDTRDVQERNRLATKVRVQLDGGKAYEPALSRYPGFGQLIGTPSVKTGWREDVYLTVTRLPEGPAGSVTLRVIIQPMAMWLWVGGGVMALGTALAAWPGRRRRPTDPTSAPVDDGEPRVGVEVDA